MLLLFSITSVLYFLLSLAVLALVLWFVWWVITSLFGFAIPARVWQIICVIIAILVVIWAVNEFFGGGGGSGIHITR